MLDNDFSQDSNPEKAVAKATMQGGIQEKKRNWLKVYETLPCQLLKGYGAAKYVKIDDKDMWIQMHEPLRSGASCMSELCMSETDRQGVGINRWLLPLKSYLEYQNENVNKVRNKMILNVQMFDQVYAEIDKILPSVIVCLAPRKYAEKTGANLLRSSGSQTGTIAGRPQSELEKHAKILYDWLDVKQVSRIRMLMNWQAAGGLAYVTSCHHRGVQCYRMCGAGSTAEKAGTLSLETFQAAIVSCHVVGSAGIDETETADGDFAASA